MSHIKFWTSGWRAILWEEFILRNVQVVCQAIAQVLKQEKIGQQGLIIGYDARFLGEKFARAVAEVFAANGMSVLICDREPHTHHFVLNAAAEAGRRAEYFRQP